MRHFLCIQDCTSQQLNHLLELSIQLKGLHRQGRLKRTLEGKILAMVFEKASLRTRMSFQVAMADLGGLAIHLKPDDIGILGQREPVKDIARVLGRYAHGIMARTYSHQTLIELAQYAGVPVINALSDWSHPCQAMADMLTIKEHCGRLEGIKLAFIGDGNNVARALAFASAKLGLSMAIASPEGYELDDQTIQAANAERPCLVQLRDPVEVVQGADVIYTDTWISMGQEAQTEQRLRAFQGYQVNAELLRHAPNAKIMHCLPAHRGHEITDEVAESPNSVIFDQAENRLHFQRALLQELLGKQ
ncbi:MAG: ornithine carbamoyltransferase [Sedimentisphaerales bacterium]|jgi:ornithine carbamoyltransferase|nr:ornithine carbamoyltransferase [Sedimentisphaerales bacterium]